MKKYRQLALATALASTLFSCSTSSTAPQAVAPPQPVLPVPTEAQMAWHEMEMNAFVHFTTNTFTDLEWGYGDESPTIFNPTALDADQWVRTLKDAGFKGVILTCKHHDGFALWPSKFTEHSVKNSPYKNGEGDVVKEVADACKAHGLKFGVYLSPWDRNRADYGQASYIEYYRNQLKEIFNAYGPAFEMWFDGANGGDGYYGGAREKRTIDRATYYDWPTTLAMVSQVQPNPKVLFFSDGGPDLRWCGNEQGIGGETNWNTISNDTLYAGKFGVEELLNTGSEDGDKWIPAEVNTSIRPGWFYHEKEDSQVKTPEQLFDLYLTSVGRGSTLLLNLPPDKRGLIHENDVKALQGWRKLLDQEFKTNLAAKAKADTYRGNAKAFAAANLTDGDKETYWTTDDNTTSGSLEIDLGKVQPVKYVLLQEYIKLGQRVKSFSVDVWQENTWKPVATATTIGYKRILKLDDPVSTSKIRITIQDAKASPVISAIEVY
ncbi:alpha-L-fucosidase [Pontibacter sp. 13R65]|uniref:alpha-L-fucosidase n=1 Tax=Pontibacter sp. 13R65 TaxID=3127458 RepID=UPI00301DADAD